MGKVWDIVWKLKVLSKVKFFCWKALRGFLPTRVNLHIRGMDIFIGCSMCSMAVESIDHCLFSCSKAKEIWRLTYCHDLLERDFNHCFEERWIALCEILSRDELRIITVTCWAIWGDRNNHIHGIKIPPPDIRSQWVLKYLDEFDRANERRNIDNRPCSSSVRLPKHHHWSLPPA